MRGMRAPGAACWERASRAPHVAEHPPAGRRCCRPCLWPGLAASGRPGLCAARAAVAAAGGALVHALATQHGRVRSGRWLTLTQCMHASPVGAPCPHLTRITFHTHPPTHTHTSHAVLKHTQTHHALSSPSMHARESTMTPWESLLMIPPPARSPQHLSPPAAPSHPLATAG